MHCSQSLEGSLSRTKWKSGMEVIQIQCHGISLSSSFLDILQMLGLPPNPIFSTALLSPRASTASTYHRTLTFFKQKLITHLMCKVRYKWYPRPLWHQWLWAHRSSVDRRAAKQRITLETSTCPSTSCLRITESLRWVVPVLAGRCWLQELLNCPERVDSSSSATLNIDSWAS